MRLYDTKWAMLFLCLVGTLLLATPLSAVERSEITAAPFQVRFHPEAEAIARASLQVLQDALEEFAPRLPAGDAPIRVVIAHTLDEFAEYGGWVDQVSISGMAFSGEGLIVVKAPRLRMAGDNYIGTLRHELVHILLFRNVDGDFLPRWLNEGIAMHLAGDYRWGSTFGIARMYLANRLIPYPELNRTFARRGHDGRFGDAYAQALSMTRYLRRELGEELFWEVVLATDNMPFGEALREIAGFNALEFWQRYERSLWVYTLGGIFSSGTVFIPAALLVLVVWYKKHRQNRRVMARWAAEDAALEGEQGVLTWDDLAEDPEAWKAGTEYEEKDR